MVCAETMCDADIALIPASHLAALHDRIESLGDALATQIGETTAANERLTAAEGLIEKWRYQQAGPSYVLALRGCADELASALKGEEG